MASATHAAAKAGGAEGIPCGIRAYIVDFQNILVAHYSMEERSNWIWFLLPRSKRYCIAVHSEELRWAELSGWAPVALRASRTESSYLVFGGDLLTSKKGRPKIPFIPIFLFIFIAKYHIVFCLSFYGSVHSNGKPSKFVIFKSLLEDVK
jgi:hypothetical protein